MVENIGKARTWLPSFEALQTAAQHKVSTLASRNLIEIHYLDHVADSKFGA
jgi:hypothetical protein